MLDIFYVQNFGYFEKKGVFQQPRLFSTVTHVIVSRAPGVQCCMRFLSIAAVFLASVSGLGGAQEKPKPDRNYDVQRCAPNVVSHARQRNTSRRVVRKGEKSTGYSPIVAFEILESGDVANAFVKRSSGLSNVDNYALTWVRETKYSKRPGCGVIETQADVTIDWR